MRLMLALALIPFPAVAWEFSPDPICTLIHQTPQAEIAITYDANVPQYALFVTLRDGVWADADTFQMAFLGPQSAQIGTTQHVLSSDGATLTVRDSGFGNVLDGLEFNTSAIAASGTTTLDFRLINAATAVQAFRACPDDTPATS